MLLLGLSAIACLNKSFPLDNDSESLFNEFNC